MAILLENYYFPQSPVITSGQTSPAYLDSVGITATGIGQNLSISIDFADGEIIVNDVLYQNTASIQDGDVVKLRVYSPPLGQTTTYLYTVDGNQLDWIVSVYDSDTVQPTTQQLTTDTSNLIEKELSSIFSNIIDTYGVTIQNMVLNSTQPTIEEIESDLIDPIPLPELDNTLEVTNEVTLKIIEQLIKEENLLQKYTEEKISLLVKDNQVEFEKLTTDIKDILIKELEELQDEYNVSIEDIDEILESVKLGITSESEISDLKDAVITNVEDIADKLTPELLEVLDKEFTSILDKFSDTDVSELLEKLLGEETELSELTDRLIDSPKDTDELFLQTLISELLKTDNLDFDLTELTVLDFIKELDFESFKELFTLSAFEFLSDADRADLLEKLLAFLDEIDDVALRKILEDLLRDDLLDKVIDDSLIDGPDTSDLDIGDDKDNPDTSDLDITDTDDDVDLSDKEYEDGGTPGSDDDINDEGSDDKTSTDTIDDETPTGPSGEDDVNNDSDDKLINLDPNTETKGLIILRDGRFTYYTLRLIFSESLNRYIGPFVDRVGSNHNMR